MQQVPTWALRGKNKCQMCNRCQCGHSQAQTNNPRRNGRLVSTKVVPAGSGPGAVGPSSLIRSSPYIGRCSAETEVRSNPACCPTEITAQGVTYLGEASEWGWVPRSPHTLRPRCGCSCPGAAEPTWGLPLAPGLSVSVPARGHLSLFDHPCFQPWGGFITSQ